MKSLRLQEEKNPQILVKKKKNPKTQRKLFEEIIIQQEAN